MKNDTNGCTEVNEFAEWDAKKRIQALKYLREKNPEVNEAAFFTDSTWRVSDGVRSFLAVAQSAEIEEICGKCKGGTCHLPEAVRRKNSIPVVQVSESPRGFSYLEVRWTSGLVCKYVDFKRMVKKSGVNATPQTFENYDCKSSETEKRNAKL